jgi:hypothetical protein
MRDLRFVAHLDILGMSSIVERDADAAWEILSELVAVRDRVENYEIEFRDTNERVAISDAIRSVTFSDTILLFTKGSSDTDLRCMIILVAEIFNKALSRRVPVRAGISFGKFYFNFKKSMYAGPALIAAYRAGESAQWLGIALSESVQRRAVSLDMHSGNSKVVVPWELPLKDETKSCYVVNWPAVVAHGLTVSPPLSVEQFYQPFESTFGALSQLPSEVRTKYVNTVEFLNEHLIRHAESKSSDTDAPPFS